MIFLKSVRKELNLSKDIKQTIIPNLTLEIKRGEFVAITGPSGSGKSTLLYIMGGLDKPTSGEVWLDGENIAEKNEDEMAQIRNEKIGFIYQFHFLLPEFSALDNVMMPMLINERYTRKSAKERAEMLLATVGLENKMTNKPAQLSGGQQQRVAIARSLATEPIVLFGDEPTGNLDTKSASNVYELFKKLNRELQQTIVIVTHDDDFAQAAERRIHLVDGAIASDTVLAKNPA
ncbi:ABC transporter-related protein [Chloroherpeton thalassium ATCC 35110]|uniref:ABC transporter-related protein n=1 Tax=Chloroherpeton thalassium (strain ATCC 35110 / GB-78) TaxID=517418 RepID=B3QTR2_CHLT3|nr:ABC transporter ATP-binding protein [Chloroherpeton thalassium]ACF14260.1 ABC transporter-related protein [Chloroherpeton thalassium ATCC 35110]